MTSSYDVTAPQLTSTLQQDGVDPATVNAIISYLTSQGDFSNPGQTVVIQDGGYPPFATTSGGQLPQVVIVHGTGPVTFDTSNGVGGDPNLQAIIDLDANVTVTGSNNVLVDVGDDTNTVHLNDTGNDLVLAGDGQNTLVGGAGMDTLIAGDGDLDSLQAGSGSFSSLHAGDGSFDTLLRRLRRLGYADGG